MSRRRGRILYGIAFVVLLADGVAAIWLGQVGGRWPLVALGACLVLGSLGLGFVYRRWQAALDEVDLARRALRAEVEALRRVVSQGGASGGAGGAKTSPPPEDGLLRRAVHDVPPGPRWPS
jgi:hypothetical protein